MTYHWVCNNSNTTGATCGAGTAYPSGAPDCNIVFSRVCAAQSVVFCVMFCRSLFDLLAITLSSLLRLTAIDYIFGVQGDKRRH